MLCGNQRALDNQQVDAGLDSQRSQLTGMLRGDTNCSDRAGCANLLDALNQQVSINWSRVQFLQLAVRCLGFTLGGGILCQLHQLGDLVLRIGVTGPDTLGVENRQTAQASKLSDGFRAGDGICRMHHHREFEIVGVNSPGGIDVLGRPGTPSGNECNIVQLVGPACLAANTDFNDVAHELSSHALSVEFNSTKPV